MENVIRTYTVDEAAVILRVSLATAYRLVKNGEIRANRIGKQLRIPESEIKRLTTLPEAPHETGSHD